MEWISVEERLPEDHGYVVVVHDGFSMVGWYATRDEVWRSASMVPLKPTHWMPLPEPPKE